MSQVYHDGAATLYHGDCLELLASLPKASVDLVVSSPPYWGLRKYAGEQGRLWGGNADCEHEWGSGSVTVPNMTPSGATTLTGGHNSWYRYGASGTAESNFCLRCNAWRGSYGLEPTVEMYVDHTVEVLRAIRRVLKGTGSVFWNLGDSYAGGGRSGEGEIRTTSDKLHASPMDASLNSQRRAPISPGLKPLDRCGIPERVALAAQADGWYWRSTVIWAKPNPMPESVSSWRWERCRVKVGGNGRGKEASRNTTEGRPQQDHDGKDFAPDSQWADCPGCPKCEANGGLVLRKGSWRPTSSYEVIIQLAKTADYYGDGEEVREAHSRAWGKENRPVGGRSHRVNGDDPMARGGSGQYDRIWEDGDYAALMNPAGRNLRDVWTMTTQPFSLEMCGACKRIYEPRQFQRLREVDGKRVCGCGASDWLSHFATFPEELVEKCILSSTSARGNCPKCGAPWARVVERGDLQEHPQRQHRTVRNVAFDGEAYSDSGGTLGLMRDFQTLGWLPTCEHRDLEAVPAVVLDPFMGSGTVALVAKKMGRHSIGIDLSADYLRLAVHRLGRTAQGMRLA